MTVKIIDKVTPLPMEQLHEITEEILSYQQQGKVIIFEIGKRLKHVKENDLAHGQFTQWVTEKLGMEIREAQRYMQAYEQFGNTSTLTHLDRSKVFKMLTLPKEINRHEFIQQRHVIPNTGEVKTVEEMTSRELDAVVKEERRKAGLSKPKHNKPHQQGSQIELDDFTAGIVSALQNLIEPIRTDFRSFGLSLDTMVIIGRELNKERQKILIPFLTDRTIFVIDHLDTIITCMNRDMNMWAIRSLVSFISSTSNKRTVIELASYMFPQALTEFNAVVDEFNREFDNNLLPREEEELDAKLEEYRAKIDAIYSKYTDTTSFFGNANRQRMSYGSFGTGNTQKSLSDRQILGVSDDATIDEVKRRYRELMKKLHPDTGGDAALFQLIKEAFDRIRGEDT